MSADADKTPGRCIFCGAVGALTREHVISAVVRKKLMAVPNQVSLEWNEGSTSLWAGRSGGSSLDSLSLRVVCGGCNSRWMQGLDKRAATDLCWWMANRHAKLGPDRLDVVRRFLLKLLWVIRVGEDWADPAWLRGERPEPEFMPLTLVTDGPIISRPGADFRSEVFVGAARINRSSQQLVHVIPVRADGADEAAKVNRVNAAIAVTFRAIELRLWCVLSNLGDMWEPSWPRQVRPLTALSRGQNLSDIPDGRFGPLRLAFVGMGDAPDLSATFGLALHRAKGLLVERAQG